MTNDSIKHLLDIIKVKGNCSLLNIRPVCTQKGCPIYSYCYNATHNDRLQHAIYIVKKYKVVTEEQLFDLLL